MGPFALQVFAAVCRLEEIPRFSTKTPLACLDGKPKMLFVLGGTKALWISCFQLRRLMPLSIDGMVQLNVYLQ